MTGVDLVSEATAELYAADPDGFTERRAVLAGQARAAGEASAAKVIAGLRKPTRAAWTINQLVRADPGVPARLIGLGDELRAAEGSMDGARIRELSLARRQLIDALLGQALALSGQQPPPAALREEVTTTLAAALADPEFAEQLAAGVLLRAERRPGFGFMTGPALTLVPGSGGRPAGGATTIAPRGRGRQASPAARAPASGTSADGAPASGTSAGGALTARAAAAVEAARAERERRQALAAAAEAERAERERERRATIAEAEQALAEADQAAEAAAAAEHELENAVRLLSEQLDESRQKLIEIRLSTRRAKTAQRKAREALVRLRP